MKVILDTNVLIAALISPMGAPERIYRAWQDGRFEIITSIEQLNELRRVSRTPKLKKFLTAHRVGLMVNQLYRTTFVENHPALPEKFKLHDASDEFLLAMALASGADYLVTGDKRAGLLGMGSVGRTRIVGPGEFLLSCG